MSFFDIKDPIERERIVQDYKRLKEEIREKKEKKITDDAKQALMLEKRYAPIVRSQKLMSESIVKELKMKNRETSNKNPIKTEHIKTEHGDDHDLYSGSLAEEYRNRYRMRDTDIDTEFGINFLENGVAVIGNTPVIIQGDDIIIGDEIYRGNEALWQLLTEKNEENFMQESYSEKDWENYYNILKKTNVLRQNFDPNSTRPRSSGSWKWRNILSKLWKEMKEDRSSSEEEVEEEEEEE